MTATHVPASLPPNYRRAVGLVAATPRLARRAHRAPQPRGRRCVHRRVRRPQGTPGRHRRHLAPRPGPDLVCYTGSGPPSRLAGRQHRYAMAATSAPSTPLPPSKPPRNASASPSPPDALATPRCATRGRRPGPTSCRSSTTRPRSAASSTHDENRQLLARATSAAVDTQRSVSRGVATQRLAS